jgi:predicted RNase H-like HicB family nuclease
MLYPVYVRLGDEQHAHGVTIPDFSGCFSAADEWQDLPAMIQEGIELWCEGQKLKMAKTNQFGTIGKNHEYDGGVWMLIDLVIVKWMMGLLLVSTVSLVSKAFF